MIVLLSAVVALVAIAAPLATAGGTHHAMAARQRRFAPRRS